MVEQYRMQLSIFVGGFALLVLSIYILKLVFKLKKYDNEAEKMKSAFLFSDIVTGMSLTVFIILVGLWMKWPS